MAHRISVRDQIGRFCVSQADGAKLRALVEPHLENGEPVVLDFTGVDGHLTVFYNEAIGRLYGLVGAEAVDQLLTKENISDLGAEVYEQSADHARWLFGLTDEERQAFDNDIEDLREDD